MLSAFRNNNARDTSEHASLTPREAGENTRVAGKVSNEARLTRPCTDHGGTESGRGEGHQIGNTLWKASERLELEKREGRELPGRAMAQQPRVLLAYRAAIFTPCASGMSKTCHTWLFRQWHWPLSSSAFRLKKWQQLTTIAIRCEWIKMIPIFSPDR